MVSLSRWWSTRGEGAIAPVDEPHQFAPWLPTVLSLVVGLVWAAAVLISIFYPERKVPPELQGVFMMILAGVVGSEALRKGRK